jgi:hypothetical protein
MSRGGLGWRWLVLAAYAFWQGGFTFYGGVVVPVGRRVLGDMTQATVTREVTVWLNAAGAVTLSLMALELFLARDPSRRRLLARWLLWLGMAVTLAGLFWLHPQLDRLMDLETNRVLDRATFRSAHRLYLWLSTLQWACGLAYGGLALAGWRAADRAQ